jgi:hypothetical protein
MVDIGLRVATRTGQRGWKIAGRGVVAAGGVALLVLGTSAPAFAAGGSSPDSTTNADINASGDGFGVHLGIGSDGAPTPPPVPASANVDGLVSPLSAPWGAATSRANRVLSPLGIGLDASEAAGRGGTGNASDAGSSPLGASVDGQGALTHGAGVSSDAHADAQAGPAPASPPAPEFATFASAAGARDANAHGAGLTWEIVGIAAGALGAAAGANIYVLRRVRQAP